MPHCSQYLGLSDIPVTWIYLELLNFSNSLLSTSLWDNLSNSWKNPALSTKPQAFHLDTPLQRFLSSLAAYFVGEVCTTFGKGLAALQCFEKLLTDYSKTTMCRSHHFPDSPDDGNDAVFSSCYAFPAPHPPFVFSSPLLHTCQLLPAQKRLVFFLTLSSHLPQQVQR